MSMTTDSGRRRWAALAVIVTAQFMVILDVTVVNVALPSIGKALRFAATDLQWVVTVYVLFTGGLMLLGGVITTLLGWEWIFFINVPIGFVVAAGVVRLLHADRRLPSTRARPGPA